MSVEFTVLRAEFTRKRKEKYKALFLGILIITLLLATATASFGQGTQSASNKADSNLRASTRVNPLTLAMELSIPLGIYPGRAGNSIPVVFSYSSKVWNMDMTNFRQEGYSLPDNGTYNYEVLETTDVTGQFAEKSAAGWTSGVRPPAITTDFEVYDQYSQRYQDLTSSQGEACREGDIPGTTCTIYDQWYIFVGTNVCASGMAQYTLWLCTSNQTEQPHHTEIEASCVPGSGGGPPSPLPSPSPFNPLPTPQPSPTPAPPVPHHVSRLYIKMADGTAHEFRKDDSVLNCATGPCPTSYNGTYLSVDSSAMRLEMGELQPNQEIRDVLYLPDGGSFIFPISATGPQSTNRSAEKFIDRNGNESSFDKTNRKWIDTMGRDIVDPLPDAMAFVQPGIGTQTYNMKGIGNSNLPYTLKWQILGDVLDTAHSTGLKPLGRDKCTNILPDPVTENVLFENQPAPNPEILNGVNYVRRHRTCTPGWMNPGGVFNPVVLGEIGLPNGTKYSFEYNEYGEITKIIYPLGGYERFVYGQVPPIGFTALEIYTQGNRGVTHRYVSTDGISETESWSYGYNGNKLITIAPDGSKAEVTRYSSGMSAFGFEDPRAGMIKEETVKDANGAIRSRTLNDWIVRGPQGTNPHQDAKRDPRLKRSVTILFESNSNSALATMSATDYDETGNALPEYFSHLNAKRQLSYHYAVIPDKTQVDVENIEWDTIESWFPASKLSSVVETDYSYDEAYLDRGITSRPIGTFMLNPATFSPANPNRNDPLGKTQMIYDQTGEPYGLITAGSATGWSDPGSNLRGNVTTSSRWVKETDSWISTHAKFDKFGNLRKSWDASDDPDKFIETEYSATYNYAYPTKVISPAPAFGASNHVTTEASSTETTYDPTTGLPLSVKDDFGQITTTEYDAALRPVRVNPVVVGGVATGPVTETAYGQPNYDGRLPVNERFIKVRKQIDGSNWDETTTFIDGLGRTVKTIAKDSQGDVITETKYDLMGRPYLVSNPYRDGDPVYWTRKRYDATGRVVESYAPAPWAEAYVVDPELNSNLISIGTTSYGISDVTSYVGTVTTTQDASDRRGRSITNALGQLIRVDEATAIGGSNDLGPLTSPNQPTSYTYDPYGNMVKVEQDGASGQKRYFKYDSLGRLIRVNQPEQEINSNIWLHDSYNPSSQWTAAFTYDNLGNVVTAIDSRHVTVANTYDRAGRVVTRAYYGETGTQTPTVLFFYDGKGLDNLQTPNYAKGKLTKVYSDISQTRYTQFDSLGRLKEMEQRTPAGTEQPYQATPRVTKYTYNLSGALLEEEYPSGRKIKNEFGSDGDLQRVYGRAGSAAPEQTYASSFSYTASGGVKHARLGNGKWETTQYNSRDQLTQIGLGNSATDTSTWKTEFHYGELSNDGSGSVNINKNTGNIAKQVLTIPGTSFTQSYKYDALYRLTEAKEWTGTNNSNPNWMQVFGYDAYGNRTSFNQSGSGVSTITATPSVSASTNRLTTGGFTYDKNGNITADIDPVNSQARTFVFNGDNKQIEVKNASGLPIGKYYYDGEGKRVKKVTDSETTIFVYSGSKLAEEYSTQVSTNPTIAYTTTDHLGSPRIITDKLGQINARRDFMPFGEEIYLGVGGRTGDSGQKYASTQDNVRQKFTGYQQDKEISLDFAEARMYENRLGRFTAVDPLLASGKSANPQTFNRFVYAGNNPIIRTDPNGEEWYVTFKYKKGRLEYAEPEWCVEGCRGRLWGRTYDDIKIGKTNYTLEASFVFQDPVTRKFTALDPYSSEKAQVDSLNEAQSAFNGFVNRAVKNLAIGIGDGLSLTFYIGRKLVGVEANEDHETYQVGSRTGTATAIAAVPLTAGSGIFNLAVSKSAKVILASGKVGGEKLPMSLVRIIGKGEKVDDIINEAKGLTWTSKQEHALVTLADGRRALVSGGEGGITFQRGQIKRVFGHTHPDGSLPSADDALSLQILGNSQQRVFPMSAPHPRNGLIVRPPRSN